MKHNRLHGLVERHLVKLTTSSGTRRRRRSHHTVAHRDVVTHLLMEGRDVKARDGGGKGDGC